MDVEMLKELSESSGVSGFEEEIRDVIKKHCKGYYDDIKEDSMGNIIFRVGRGRKKVLIESHMDEVGIIVKHIDDKGFVYFSPLGGLNPYTLINARFKLSCKNKKSVYAVCGSKPVHLMEEDESNKIKIRDLYLDFGVKDKKEIEKIGVEVGDILVFDSTFVKVGKNCVSCKSLDNRAGCYASIQLMRKIAEDEELKKEYTFFFAFTVQEEVGLKGARVVAFNEKVDFALVIDTAPAGDTPGIESKVSDLKLGGGVVIEYVQAEGRGLITKKTYVQKMIKVFKKNKIPYQIEIGVGGVSDAAIIYISRQGIPTVGLGIAVRYLHTPVEVVDLDDLKNLIEASYLIFKERLF